MAHTFKGKVTIDVEITIDGDYTENEAIEIASKALVSECDMVNNLDFYDIIF